MATWTEPKTDWVQGDSFTYADYNRIKNNLVYLNDWFNEIFPDPYIINLGPDKGLPSNDGTLRKQDYIYASEFNAFEDCIDHFIRTGAAYTEGERGYYRPNGPFLTPAQLNRIERLTAMYKAINVEVDSLAISGLDYYLAESTDDFGRFQTTYIPIIEPYEARYSPVTWSVSDPTVATIDAYGVCTIMGQGTTIIYAESKGKRASKTLTVSLRVEDFVITGGTEPIEVGDDSQITISVQPPGAVYRVEYSSDDPSVATVDQTGKIHGVGAGTTIIHVRIYQGDELVAEKSYSIFVNTQIVPVRTMHWAPNSHGQVSVGTVIQDDIVTFYPDNATLQNFTIHNSNSNVVEVISDTSSSPYRNSTYGYGEIYVNFRVIGAGSAELWADVNNGDVVSNHSSIIGYVEITNIIIDVPESGLEISNGDTVQIPVTVVPGNATHSLTYTSSDTSVATVDANGNVTGEGNGTATITVSADGITKTVTVKVKTNVAGITLNKNTGSMYYNATDQLVATVTPNDASNKNVNWSSSDNTIATVSSTGLVTSFAKDGTVTITAITEDGGYSESCVYTVSMEIIPPVSVIITPHEFSTAQGSTTELLATVSPANATVTDIRWSVDNANFNIVNSTTEEPYTCTVQGATTGTTGVRVDVNNYVDVFSEGLIPQPDKQYSDSYESYTCVDGLYTYTGIKKGSSTNLYEKFTYSQGKTYKIVFELYDDVNSDVNLRVRIPYGGTYLPEMQITTKGEYVLWFYPPSNHWNYVAMLYDKPFGPIKFRVQAYEQISSTYTGGGVYDIATGICYATATALSVSPTTLSMVEEQTSMLTATVTPASEIGRVVWSSNDTSIATVDQSGNVTCVGGGTTTIWAQIDSKQASCSVVGISQESVVINPIPVTIEKQNLINSGISKAFNTSVQIQDATGFNVTWISDNEMMAFKVESSGGYYTGQKTNATIYGGAETKNCNVTAIIGGTKEQETIPVVIPAFPQGYTYTESGITITINADHSITLNGTSTGERILFPYGLNKASHNIAALDSNETYHIVCESNQGVLSNVYFRVGKFGISFIYPGDDKRAIPNGTDYGSFLFVTSGTTVNNLILKLQIFGPGYTSGGLSKTYAVSVV